MPGGIAQPESLKGFFETESIAGGAGKEFFTIAVTCCNAESTTDVAVSAGVWAAIVSAKRIKNNIK